MRSTERKVRLIRLHCSLLTGLLGLHSGLTQATCSCRDGEGWPTTAGDSRTVGSAVGSAQRGATGRGVEQLLLRGLPGGCAAEAEGWRRSRTVSGVGAVVRHARGARVPRLMAMVNVVTLFPEFIPTGTHMSLRA